MNQRFGCELSLVQLSTFYPHQENEQGNFYKKLRFFIFGRSVGDGKVTNRSQVAQNWNFLLEFGEIFSFLSTLATTSRCYAVKN